jgi:hypothetical protein
VPAWRAIGYEPGASPPAWRGATNAVVDAAGVVACAAVERLVTDPTWSWRTPPADADAVARMAARASLRRVEGRYRRSTRPLVERLLAVTASPVPA